MKSFPNISIEPEEGNSRPNNIERVVVLPAPLPPNKAVIELFLKDMDKLSTATIGPNFLDSEKVLKSRSQVKNITLIDFYLYNLGFNHL